MAVDSRKTLTLEEFVGRAVVKHSSFYDYSKAVYKDSKTKVCIVCPDHGEFYQNPANHLFGKGCFLCGATGKKLKQEEFIRRAKGAHKDTEYDYSKVFYSGLDTKVCVVCPIHGDFYQTPSNHLRGSGCPVCGMENRIEKKSLTKETFIARSLIMHKNTYEYSKVEYKKAQIKVCIVCPAHGEFYQRPFEHMAGRGCKKCDVDKRRLSLETFLLKAESVHGRKYNYSKVRLLKNSRDKVYIICPIHGEFWQIVGDHISGSNCPSCRATATSFRLLSTTEEFVKKALKMYGEEKFDYSKVVYTDCKTKVCIVCNKHGEFFKRPNDFLNGRGCPYCKFPKGELAVSNWFKKNNIALETQYFYPDLTGPKKKPLLFDFFVPSKKMLIEYDGVQHFRPVRFNGISLEKAVEVFEKAKHNDTLKNQYCTEKSIPLLRIPYKEYKRISEILTAEILNN